MKFTHKAIISSWKVCNNVIKKTSDHIAHCFNKKWNKNKTKTFLIVGAIFAVAFILRSCNLYKFDLWFDEIVSDWNSFEVVTKIADFLRISRVSFLLRNIKTDPHSPLYYLVVYFYSFLFGGEKSLRILSFIFSMFSLYIFYRFSRLFFKRSESTYPLLLMAFSPVQIWYAQEARAYALVCFFAILMIYCWIKALRTNRIFYWISFSISSTFAIFFSYYSFLLLIASGFVLFFNHYRCQIKKWILFSIVPLLFFLSLSVGIFINQSSFVKNNFWLPSPSLKTILLTLAVFNLGYSANFTVLVIGLVLFFILFVYGIYFYYQSNRYYAVILFLFLFFPIASVYAFSKLIMPIYITRQLLISLPFYYLLVAKGISGIKRPALRMLGILFILLLMALSIINYYRGFMLPPNDAGSFYTGVLPKKDYSELFDYVIKNLKKSDLLVATDIQSLYILRYYSIHSVHLPQVRIFFYPQYLSNHTRYGFGIEHLADKSAIKEENQLYSFGLNLTTKVKEIKKITKNYTEYKRIWLISSSWEKNDRLSINSLKVREYMLSSYKREFLIEKDGIFIELYTLRS